MKATRFLKQQHKEVKGLFAQYERASKRERKREIFERIRHALEGHAQIEEEIFYPAVADANVGREGKELVREARQEHEVVKTLLEEISGLSPSDDQYDAKTKVLQENVEHHVEEEEGELFQKAERAIPNGRMQELGTALEERHETLEQPFTARIARGVKNLFFGEDEEPARQDASQRSGKTQRGARRAGARGSAAARGKSGASKGGARKKTAQKRRSARANGARKGAGGPTSTRTAGKARATGGRGSGSTNAHGRGKTGTGRGRHRS